MEQTTIKQLHEAYKSVKSEIRMRLKEFKSLSLEEKRMEFLYCTLTPQSQALRCWQAVEQIAPIKEPSEEQLAEILRTKTRFHNNKARYIVQNREVWNKLQTILENTDVRSLRNWLADIVRGYGMKEASHFLRNIGRSNNQIAILDRHILRNLKEYKVIENDKIKNREDYLEKEEKYLQFAQKIGIPADELDLLWWSQENGSIFK